MVCIPLIYRYLGGFLGFFVSFLVTFRAIFHLWNDFGTPLEKHSCTLWKTCVKLEKVPICTHLHLCWCQRYTSPVSNSKNDCASIYRAFTAFLMLFGRKYTKLSSMWCPSVAKCHPSRKNFFQNFSLPKIFPPFTLPLEISPYSILCRRQLFYFVCIFLTYMPTPGTMAEGFSLLHFWRRVLIHASCSVVVLFFHFPQLA